MSAYRFLLSELAYKRNPFPVWAEMRNAGPVIRVKFPLIGKVWLFTSYEAASKMLRDDELFVRDPHAAGRKYVAGFLGVMPKSVRVLADNMLSVDGAQHKRLRGIVDKAFQFRSIEQMRPTLEQLADDLLQKMQRQHVSSEPVDFIQGFAREYPLAAISDLLGLPVSDRERFKSWGLKLSSLKSFYSLFQMFPGLWKIRNYIKEQVEECRNSPRDGLLSALVHTEHDGDRLNEEELLAMGFLLLLAGHETTVHLLSTSLATLFQHPQQLQLLKEDWSLAGSAVEEVMRYVTPAEISKPRMLSRDVELHGQQLKRGDYAVAMLGAANHDPNQFENPDDFEITRSPNVHLGFGTGIHVCLGMKLARTETEVALQALFERFPDVELAVPPDQLAWSQRIGFRSLDTLPLRLHR